MLFGLDKLLTMMIIVINKNHLHQNAHKEYKNIVIVIRLIEAWFHIANSLFKFKTLGVLGGA